MKPRSGFGTTLLVVPFVASLQGCGDVPNRIESIGLAPGQTPALDTPLTVEVRGSGTCTNMTVDWGDGNREDFQAVTFGGSPECQFDTDSAGRQRFQCNVRHTFTGWGGGKTVTAIAKARCDGRVNTRFVIEPSVYILAFARPGSSACNVITNRPSLVNRTLVKITTVPPGTRCPGIRYPDGHCYDAEGVAVLSVAGDPFPFPGMRMNSLVLRVGTQVVQGGTNMNFVTNQEGGLETCLNELDPMAGNGGYEIHIRADQLGPPPPP